MFETPHLSNLKIVYHCLLCKRFYDKNIILSRKKSRSNEDFHKLKHSHVPIKNK